MSSSRQPYHDPSGDEVEHAYFCYLADKFERQPELLEKPLQTVERWISSDHHGSRYLLRWRSLMQAARQTTEGMKVLVQLLRADDEETRFFKGFAPMPGILTREEKRQFLCASRH
jgi:hypothetical protein